MTAYALQNAPHAGLQLTPTTPTTGSVDTCPTGANIGLLIVGPSSASATLAIPVPNVDGLAVTARSVTIATGQTWLVPMPSAVYGPGPVTLTWGGTLTACVVYLVATPQS
jgi:hypothetical protein